MIFRFTVARIDYYVENAIAKRARSLATASEAVVRAELSNRTFLIRFTIPGMTYVLFRIAAYSAYVFFASSPSIRADMLSDCQWATNNAELVVEACSTLIREQKTSPAWMHFNLGLALKVLGRLEEAEGAYSRAIELDPSYGSAYVNRGNVRLMRSNLAGALADYRVAVRLNPKDKTAQDNLRSVVAALRKIGAGKGGKGAGAEPLLEGIAPQYSTPARR